MCLRIYTLVEGDRGTMTIGQKNAPGGFPRVDTQQGFARNIAAVSYGEPGRLFSAYRMDGKSERADVY